MHYILKKNKQQIIYKFTKLHFKLILFGILIEIIKKPNIYKYI